MSSSPDKSDNSPATLLNSCFKDCLTESVGLGNFDAFFFMYPIISSLELFTQGLITRPNLNFTLLSPIYLRYALS